MRKGCFRFIKIFFRIGGVVFPSFFLCLSLAFSDTVTLKNDKELKGLVVENHHDRIIFSTEKGEIPILLSGIKNIQYGDAEQNFFQMGKSYEVQNKFGQALAYYEKALEINPHLEEARLAAQAVRNRFWAESTAEPQREIEKQQLLQDAWSRGGGIAQELIKKEVFLASKLLRERLGLEVEKKKEWVQVKGLEMNKQAAQAGLAVSDRLVHVDGESMRYLAVEAVSKKLLSPRFSDFTLEIERDLQLEKNGQKNIKALGFKLMLEPTGLQVSSVYPRGAAQRAGLKKGDMLTTIDGKSIRYLPSSKAIQIIERAQKQTLILTVRRSVLLARK